MTVANPRGQENPSTNHTWPVAVVTLIDRALGSRVRFRRLLVLLGVIGLVLVGAVLLAPAFPVSGLLTGLLSPK